MSNTSHHTYVFKTAADPNFLQKMGLWFIRKMIWVLWCRHETSERIFGISIVAASCGNDVNRMHKIYQISEDYDFDHYGAREAISAYAMGNDKIGDDIVAESEC